MPRDGLKISMALNAFTSSPPTPVFRRLGHQPLTLGNLLFGKIFVENYMKIK